MVRISEIQQFSDFQETFPGTFRTFCSRFESYGIFAPIESAPGVTIAQPSKITEPVVLQNKSELFLKMAMSGSMEKGYTCVISFVMASGMHLSLTSCTFISQLCTRIYYNRIDELFILGLFSYIFTKKWLKKDGLAIGNKTWDNLEK